MNRRELMTLLAGIPMFAALTEEVAAMPESTLDLWKDVPPGDVGTKLLYENEQVKVWEFVLDPGEAIPMHTHQQDYLFHVYQGGTLEVTYPAEAKTEPKRVELKAGDVRFAAKGGRHMARNVSDKRYVEVLVELKK